MLCNPGETQSKARKDKRERWYQLYLSNTIVSPMTSNFSQELPLGQGLPAKVYK